MCEKDHINIFGGVAPKFLLVVLAKLGAPVLPKYKSSFQALIEILGIWNLEAESTP